MNFDMTLFALLTICAALTLATVHNEEEDDNDAEEEEEQEEVEGGNGRNVLDELDFFVPGRRSLARLLHSVTSTPKHDVSGDAASAAHARSSYTSREVKIHNLYLWMLLDEPDRGLRRSSRTKKDQVKDQLREDHIKDHLRDHLPVRESRRRKLAGLFKVNGSKEVPEEVESASDGECPLAVDGQRLFFCPTPDEMGQHRCIDDENLCDRTTDCPNAEDEDPTACMFHGLTRTYFRLVIETILRLIRPLSYSSVQRGPVQSSVPHRRSVKPVGEATFDGYSASQRNEGATEYIL